MNITNKSIDMDGGEGMNQINNTYVGNVCMNGRKVIVGGKPYKIPTHIKCTSISIVNNSVFIDGYEFKNGEWKMTLKALFHLIF